MSDNAPFTESELQLWDRFAAAALSGAMTDKPASYIVAAANAARAADELLLERRKRKQTTF